jgi:ABC-2 type transport system ATP-binding protein
VLVSSHLLSEVQQSVDRVVIISHGALVYEGGLAGLESAQRVLADAPDRPALESALLAAGATIEPVPGGLAVTGLSPERVGAVAQAAGVALSLLAAERTGIEKAFLELVGEGGRP